MLSGRLIHQVEAHWGEITSRVLREIRTHPEVQHMRQLPEMELREAMQHTLENLDYWLAVGNEAAVAKHYEVLGRVRFEEGVPLHEAVRCVAMLKEKILEFTEEQANSRDALALYAEEQFERRMGQFFDALLVQMVRGYEGAWRRAVRAA